MDGSSVPAFEDPGAGQVRLALGDGTEATLDITTCSIGPPAQADSAVPSTLVEVAADGVDGQGAELHLAVSRYSSQGASATLTDTVTLATGDPEALDDALVAQRFEVDGVITDPRDPTEGDPLLRVGDGRVEASGVFAPPGAFDDDGGLVPGRVVAVCG